MTTKKLTFLGLMLALILILTMLENMLPPFPMLPPQFGRIGLSNVIIMYLIFFLGKKEAVAMAVIKALFSVLTRGPIAGLLSLAGGLLAVVMICFLLWVFKHSISYVALSIAGAIGHNVGQLLTACVIMQNWNLFVFYFPVLLISGVIFGTITGVFLQVIMPVFNKIHKGW